MFCPQKSGARLLSLGHCLCVYLMLSIVLPIVSVDPSVYLFPPVLRSDLVFYPRVCLFSRSNSSVACGFPGKNLKRNPKHLLHFCGSRTVLPPGVTLGIFTVNKHITGHLGRGTWKIHKYINTYKLIFCLRFTPYFSCV